MLAVNNKHTYGMITQQHVIFLIPAAFQIPGRQLIVTEGVRLILNKFLCTFVMTKGMQFNP